jgi:branched-chain amino acid transport system ATP-binding protein
MLELRNLDVFYGDAQALWDVSLHVQEGEIVTLLGSNGSGKTTTLKSISGILHSRKGSIHLDGTQIAHIPPYEIVRKGIAHIPEGRRLFPNMTVLETLVIGAFIPSAWKHRSEALEQVLSLFPILRERKNQMAGTLSGGEQQMLAIGRGLMSHPKILMLDEPSLGLAPIIVDKIFKIIQDINGHGVSILLIEQNANMALQVANRGYVLETGRITHTDLAQELLRDDHVKKAYLGLYEETQ